MPRAGRVGYWRRHEDRSRPIPVPGQVGRRPAPAAQVRDTPGRRMSDTPGTPGADSATDRPRTVRLPAALGSPLGSRTRDSSAPVRTRRLRARGPERNTCMSTTTSALNAALDGLPAKPRVHELAKRSGASSREIIAALADRGVTVTSASSSVDRDTALAVLTELLGEPEPSPASTAPDQSPAIADAPAGAQAAVDSSAISPLFLPPQAPTSSS